VTGVLLIALGALFDGIGLLLLVPMLDIATRYGGSGFSRLLLHILGGYAPTCRLLLLLGMFALLMLLRALVLVARDRTINGLQVGFVEAVRMRLIRRLAVAGWSRTTKVSHAGLVQALSVDIYQLGIAANSALTTLVALVTMVGFCGLALIIAPAAGSAALGFAFIAGVAAYPFLRKAGRLGRVLTEAHFGLTGQVMTFLNGLKVATAQGTQSRFVSAYGSVSAGIVQDLLASIALQTSLRTLITTLAACIGVLALFLGVVIAHLAPALLIALLLVLSRMIGPALAVQQGLQQIAHSLPSYGVILALEAELANGESGVEAGHVTPADVRGPCAIVFDEVSFHYPSAVNSNAGLENVNITLPAGAFIGVSGPSGSGKTTFLDLVAGVLEPQTGAVCVGGYALAGAALDQHRRSLAYVAQDPFLFDDTVRQNLLWSCDPRSDDELHAAVALVGADVLVSRLPQGLGTRLGERGALISAGERQRLALARALLRRPKLLILDEATNALDVAGEHLILERLAAMRPAATVLMVAHRRESLALCDHIVVFPEVKLSRLADQGADQICTDGATTARDHTKSMIARPR
jgi:ATP-binding cassette subfamily C protein